MNKQIHPVLSRIAPIISIVVFVIFVILGVILFSYLLLFGAALALVIYIVTTIRRKFSPSHPSSQTKKSHHKQTTHQSGEGRTFDHED